MKDGGRLCSWISPVNYVTAPTSSHWCSDGGKLGDCVEISHPAWIQSCWTIISLFKNMIRDISLGQVNWNIRALMSVSPSVADEIWSFRSQDGFAQNALNKLQPIKLWTDCVFQLISPFTPNLWKNSNCNIVFSPWGQRLQHETSHVWPIVVLRCSFLHPTNSQLFVPVCEFATKCKALSYFFRLCENYSSLKSSTLCCWHSVYCYWREFWAYTCLTPESNQRQRFHEYDE